MQQPLESVHFLRNTFDGFNLFGYYFPVAGVYTRDIQIKNNTFITPPDKPCNSTIGLGGYPDNPNTIKGAYIENNTIVSYGTAIILDSIEGGTLKNNKITTLVGGGCGTAEGPPPLIKVSARSTNVIQENNGPNAPGAGGGSTSTPTPPVQVSPTISPSLSPTPLPTTSCPAPTNFTGVAGPAGSGRWDFTWSPSANASSYSFYYSLPPAQPATIYAGPFPSSPASAFSLNPNTQYNFAIRAKCAAVESANSNIFLVNGSGITQQPSPTRIPTVPPTPPPGSTLLSLNVFLHTIGNSGDNINQGNHTGSNKNPRNKTRTVNVEIRNNLDQVVATGVGSVVYASASGSFRGTVGIPNLPSTGEYEVKIKEPTHLQRTVPGIHLITKGATSVLGGIHLIAGDANGDNKLNILDFNFIDDCFGNTANATCTPDKRTRTDFDDNGVVDFIDYNILLRELGVQVGE